jgi:hypothetical protein
MTMLFLAVYIAFCALDVVCYVISNHGPLFKGWWLPGSGIYAMIKWGSRL